GVSHVSSPVSVCISHAVPSHRIRHFIVHIVVIHAIFHHVKIRRISCRTSSAGTVNKPAVCGPSTVSHASIEFFFLFRFVHGFNATFVDVVLRKVFHNTSPCFQLVQFLTVHFVKIGV